MNVIRIRKLKRELLYLYSILIFTLLSPWATAAPENKALPFWAGNNEKNDTVVEHTPWQNLLNKYLDSKHPTGINRFDYAAVNATDLKVLNDYITSLKQLNPRDLNRAEQKAYWINLYNALTVALIIKNYPVKSITKVGDSFFSFGPWDDELITIQGQKLSLNNIEHGILRPFFKDSRIHYAVNCASISCPNLSATAYTAKNMEQLLEEGAKQYVNHSRGVTFAEGELKVSSIYHWYKEDFGGNNKSLIAHLIQYAKPTLAKQLAAYKGNIDHDYDWDLNQP